MDIEDRRRYFIVGSVILEIVQPLFRTRLENDYKSRGLGSLQAFLSSQPVIHILFHLRHRNAFCCKDKINCCDNSKLPLIYCQWNLLYTESPGQRGHNCHCKFTANQVQLNDLDISLAGLILLNCCNLAPADDNAVHKLRRYKNDYLSHNTEGEISETEYKSLWTNLTNFVLQLDPNKRNDLMRIENRPLDEGLCSKYSIDLLNIHKKLNEMDTRMQEIGSDVQELLIYHRKEAICQYCKKKLNEQGIGERKIIPYNLGEDIFNLQHVIHLPSLLNERLIEPVYISGRVVMMDDGRLVMRFQRSLLICNTDGSQVDSIPVHSDPWYVTAFNNSTVAVTVSKSFNRNCCIEMYDINNKHKLKSISVPGMLFLSDITMINKKFIVGGEDGLLIIDHQTGETIQTIETNIIPGGINASGDKIFFTNLSIHSSDRNLYRYSFTDDIIHTLTLPSTPYSLTTLQDGSLYVLCEDGSVQHVSSDVKQFKTLNKNQSQFFKYCSWIRYNSKQRKIITGNDTSKIVKILQEK